MERTWICESCYGKKSMTKNITSPVAQTFVLPEVLIQHIKHNHVSRKEENGHTVFICKYGPDGICNRTNVNNSHSRKLVAFDSEYDLERHLTTKHVISSAPFTFVTRSKKLGVPDSPRHTRMQCDSVINMAAVLNDPTDRQLDIFSRYWGDSFERTPVPPLRIPPIDQSQFFVYLNLLAKRNISIHSSQPSKTISSYAEPLKLESVKVYCSDDFSLSNSDTFNSVIPLFRRRLCPNLIELFSQQSDRLSQYLDAVELAIVSHVSERSPAFFEVVRAHNVVKDLLSQTASQVKAVRSRLEHVDVVYCRGAARVARLAHRRANLRTLLSKLEVVASVHAVQPTIQTFLKANDFCSALDLIANTHESLSIINNPNNGDSGGEITCLRHLNDQLTELANFISNMVSTEFETALTFFLSSSLQGPADTNISEVLLSSVLGFVRIGQTEFVATMEKEIDKALNSIFERAHEISQSSENGHSQEITRKSSADSGIREHFNVWLKDLKAVCAEVEQLLLRVRKLIEAITSTVIDQDEQLRRIYWTTTNRAQGLIATHFHHSRSQNRLLNSSDNFVALAQFIEAFHQRVIASAWKFYRPELPLTSGLMVLRNLVTTQATVLVQTFHDNRCEVLKRALDQEMWCPSKKPLDSSVASLLGHLLTYHSLKQSAADEITDNSAASGTKLVLLDETYVVVEAVFTAVGLLLEYLQLSEQLEIWPLLFRDIKRNLATFLKIFNSRSCELVLGGEAYQNSSLKTISSRSLALVARSLECLLVLIPVVQIFFERIHLRLIQKNANVQNSSISKLEGPLVAVEQDIRSHISHVIDKLTNLLAARMLKSMRPWRPRPPTPTPEIRSICQSISKLTELTSDILSPKMLTNLLLRINCEFKACLRKSLVDLSIFPGSGPQQSLVNADLAFYLSFFCGLTPILAQFAEDWDDVWPSQTMSEEVCVRNSAHK